MKKINLLSSFIQKSINEGPTLVKKNIYSKNIKLKTRNEYNNIKKMIDNFLKGKNNNQIIYISGLRGVGKTTLVFQLFDYLMEKGIKKEQILYFSGDNLKQLLNNTFHDIVKTYIHNYHAYNGLKEKIFIFVDEAQESNDYYKQAKNINNTSKNIFILIIGTKKLTTDNNYNTINSNEQQNIPPLNFREYLTITNEIKTNKKLPQNLINTIQTGQINETNKLEKEFYKSINNKELSIEKSHEHYILCGSFPNSMHLNSYWAHKKIYKSLNRIIEKDIILNKNFTCSKTKINQILSYIALQESCNFTLGNLAKYAKLSYPQLFKILNTLETLNLIFHFNPYNGQRGVKKIKNYYFITPNFHASINSQINENPLKNKQYMEILIESQVASILLKMKNIHKAMKINISSEKNQSTFLIKTKNNNIIPLDINIGEKQKINTKNSIDKYDSPYGVIISNTISKMRKNNNIIYIPITTFSLI